MAASQLPAWHRVLVVVAHPDDESFGLGAVIDAFVAAGASVWVHCLTAGEASTLGAEAAVAGRASRFRDVVDQRDAGRVPAAREALEASLRRCAELDVEPSVAHRTLARALGVPLVAPLRTPDATPSRG